VGPPKLLLLLLLGLLGLPNKASNATAGGKVTALKKMHRTRIERK
jgi:hypothetical protein